MCGDKIEVMAERGYDYKEITVRCGNTSPSGNPFLCTTCERRHAGRNWRREAEEAGESWDEGGES